MAREVWLEGQDRLYLNMNRIAEDVYKEAKAGLKRGGMKIIADAQRNLRTAGYRGGTLNNTGRLSQSGKVQEVEDGTLDIGFFSTDGSRGYAAVVEYGSKKKFWPNVAYLRAWVHKKLGVPNEEADSVAFLIGRQIAGKSPKHPEKYGLTPHPFFKPAIEKNKKALEKAISDAVNKITR